MAPNEALIDLRKAKEAALRLPYDHPVRLALLQEPDFLPRPEGIGKLETYIRLAMALRRRPS